MERERDSQDRAHDPRDRERAQRCSSRSSRPREGDEWKEHERERSPVEPPISQEGDRRSPHAETEQSTGEGSASTRDSWECDDPTTPTPGREEAAESLVPAETEGPPIPSSRPPPSGGRGEGRPRENPRGGHPPSPPSGHAPLKEGGVTEREAQGVRLPKEPRQRAEGSEAQWEGRSLKGASSKTLPTAPQTNPYKCHKSHQQNTLYPYTSHMLGAGP